MSGPESDDWDRVKQCVLAVVQTAQGGLPLQNLMDDYLDAVKRPLPLALYGFESVQEMVAEMGDVVAVVPKEMAAETMGTDSNATNSEESSLMLVPVVTGQTTHVTSMVQHQHTAPLKRFGNKVPGLEEVNRRERGTFWGSSSMQKPLHKPIETIIIDAPTHAPGTLATASSAQPMLQPPGLKLKPEEKRSVKKEVTQIHKPHQPAVSKVPGLEEGNRRGRGTFKYSSSEQNPLHKPIETIIIDAPTHAPGALATASSAQPEVVLKPKKRSVKKEETKFVPHQPAPPPWSKTARKRTVSYNLSDMLSPPIDDPSTDEYKTPDTSPERPWAEAVQYQPQQPYSPFSPNTSDDSLVLPPVSLHEEMRQLELDPGDPNEPSGRVKRLWKLVIKFTHICSRGIELRNLVLADVLDKQDDSLEPVKLYDSDLEVLMLKVYDSEAFDVKKGKTLRDTLVRLKSEVPSSCCD